MSDFSSLVAHQGSKCSNEEWTEYCWMGVVRSDETPAEWRDRILPHLMHFKENDLLPIGVEGYNYGGILKHWITSCSVYIHVSFEEIKRLKQKSESQHSTDDIYVLREYELWMKNAVRKIEHAREVGKKIRACTIIQRKVVEWIYRPDGLTAQELAFHYACLQNIRAEMRQINNA
ncbi:hypothetical protein Glove_357g55 [Diversispora epigaea]|uniref:Uncharacterized protein n=1 Tax=Diversispora epigaea TaxID=1348612 RepID=A0A397HEZ6_9GLOM|nr:hypothetical protein Glove_357g55 [Diversispora epigaea]